MRFATLLPFILVTAALAQAPSGTSTLAVVTHKAGLAKGMAHNHFVHASDFKATCSGTSLDDLQLAIGFDVAQLQVDNFDLANRWYPHIAALAVLDEPFKQVPDKDREKIRKAMLGEDQLEQMKFPRIEGKLVKVLAKPQKIGKVSYPQTLEVMLTIHGKQVKAELAGDLKIEGKKLTLNAVGALTFSQFGIKPYSAMMGMVSNQDSFHLLIHLEQPLP